MINNERSRAGLTKRIPRGLIQRRIRKSKRYKGVYVNG